MLCDKTATLRNQSKIICTRTILRWMKQPLKSIKLPFKWNATSEILIVETKTFPALYFELFLAIHSHQRKHNLSASIHVHLKTYPLQLYGSSNGQKFESLHTQNTELGWIRPSVTIRWLRGTWNTRFGTQNVLRSFKNNSDWCCKKNIFFSTPTTHVEN